MPPVEGPIDTNEENTLQRRHHLRDVRDANQGYAKLQEVAQ